MIKKQTTKDCGRGWGENTNMIAIMKPNILKYNDDSFLRYVSNAFHIL